MRFSLGRRGALVTISAIVVALAGGAVYALIPQDGIITGCYVKATGVLRVIAAAAPSCR
jgi:hypothetical protein